MSTGSILQWDPIKIPDYKDTGVYSCQPMMRDHPSRETTSGTLFMSDEFHVEWAYCIKCHVVLFVLYHTLTTDSHHDANFVDSGGTRQRWQSHDNYRFLGIYNPIVTIQTVSTLTVLSLCSMTSSYMCRVNCYMDTNYIKWTYVL